MRAAKAVYLDLAICGVAYIGIIAWGCSPRESGPPVGGDGQGGVTNTTLTGGGGNSGGGGVSGHHLHAPGAGKLRWPGRHVHGDYDPLAPARVCERCSGFHR